ncbi:hypothetical protein O3W44_21795 [Pantoea sp. LMR881]|uniref:hypothetical protein n=1 Tax=Pantoea sp. LMR881 TaxID=3014336 RepID=UPI0022AEC82A|nr:hypothetical protein [Pantoea sp. LMR881]MCZ4061164.1 hypothetical protein [Pantoea sp. LMR881]
MSEIIKDAANDAVNHVKETFSHRFNGAFTAYVATSWVAYNWSNIALLFMSNVPVEQRLQAIYGQDWLYTQYLIVPVMTGFLLSILMPGMNAFVSNLTAIFTAHSEAGQELARLKVGKKLADARFKNLTPKQILKTLKSGEMF